MSIMLLKNIDHWVGLCNGTRLVIIKSEKHVIEPKEYDREKFWTENIYSKDDLTLSNYRIPFKFQYKQFFIIIFYAMTINKN
ncbi:hypothetical protein Ahy_A03g013565 [Arachis hypogaea]|uniref:DNA helicase Pif1-like 2B domain-containing protein n=1 Tax=Arachis hypogaea TaxID=3818 RepID=A0A445DVQ9_ARAHY|nr:hypothetical protein Ahy_A03g013565 [Arachis hypogaea]